MKISIVLDCLMFLHPNFKQLPHIELFLQHCEHVSDLNRARETGFKKERIYKYIMDKMKIVFKHQQQSLPTSTMDCSAQKPKAKINEFLQFAESLPASQGNGTRSSLSSQADNQIDNNNATTTTNFSNINRSNINHDSFSIHASSSSSSSSNNNSRRNGDNRTHLSDFEADQHVNQEFNRYLTMKCALIDLDSAVEWWRDAGKDFPLLREVARELLSAFPSSAYLERDFCHGSRAITSNNTLLSDWKLAMMMILHINFDHLPPMKDVTNFISQSNFSDHVPDHLKGLFPCVAEFNNDDDSGEESDDSQT